MKWLKGSETKFIDPEPYFSMSYRHYRTCSHLNQTQNRIEKVIFTN